MNIEAKDLIVGRCDKAMFYAFCGLIYFFPISISLLEWGFSIAFLAYLVKRATIFRFELGQAPVGVAPRNRFTLFLKSFKPLSSHVNIPIALYVFIAFLSVIFSQCVPLSIKGFVFKLLESVFLCFLMVECMTSKKRIQIFITIFLISVTVITVNGIYQYIVGVGFVRNHLLHLNRVDSTFKHANDFGAYLIMVILFLLNYSFAMALSSEKRKRLKSILIRAALCGLLITSVICLGLTLSRGAWSGFFIGLAFMAFFGKRPLVTVLILFSSFILIFTPLLNQFRNVSFISDDISGDKKFYEDLLTKKRSAPASNPPAAIIEEKPQDKISTSPAILEPLTIDSSKSEEPLVNKIIDKLSDATIPLTKHNFNIANFFTGRIGGMGRTGFWSAALEIIKKNPLIGTGLNTYSKVEVKHGYPHNCYLQMAAEIGIIGLLAFLFILWRIFYNGFGTLKKIADPYYQNILMGLLAGFLGFLVHSFVDTNFYSVQLGSLMWVWMGFIIAIQKLGLEG